jgi:cell division septum initiation protein DivIVA
VTKQAGIYAGDGGYQIKVQDNTHLIGAVIASTAEADKNSLITGTLTMDNIRNKASYSTGDTGISYRHYGTKKEHDNDYNNTGLLPNLSAGAKNDAASTTKSAISQGTITATKEHLDISTVNRNAKQSLNTLGKIFDKKKVEERQALAQEFAKLAYDRVHYYSKDGSANKILAHAIVAEITSRIAGNKAGKGALADATNEALINKIRVLAKDDPIMVQWISTALGATVNKAIGKDAKTGAALAHYGTKWNFLDEVLEDVQTTIEEAEAEADAAAEAVSQAASDAMDSASQAVSDVVDAASQEAGDIVDTVTQAADEVTSTVAEAADDAMNTATQAADEAMETMSQTASNVADTVSQTASNVADTVSQTASNVTNTVSQAVSESADFSYSKSIAINSVVTTTSLPATMEKEFAQINNVNGLGNVGDMIGLGVAVNQDGHDYSGADLAEAIGADVTGSVAGIGVSYGAKATSTGVGAVIGAIGGAAGGPPGIAGGAATGARVGNIIGTIVAPIIGGVAGDRAADVVKKIIGAEKDKDKGIENGK